jgi:hypothetical protein
MMSIVLKYLAALSLLALSLLTVWPSLTVEPTDKGALTHKSNGSLALPEFKDRMPQDYSAITDRPVFLASRRAPPEPEEAKGPANIRDALQYSLVGIMIGADRKLATFVPLAKGGAITLSIGQSLDGWTVKDIQKDSVVFASGTVHKTVELAADKDPAPASQRHLFGFPNFQFAASFLRSASPN